MSLSGANPNFTLFDWGWHKVAAEGGCHLLGGGEEAGRASHADPIRPRLIHSRRAGRRVNWLSMDGKCVSLLPPGRPLPCLPPRGGFANAKAWPPDWGHPHTRRAVCTQHLPATRARGGATDGSCSAGGNIGNRSGDVNHLNAADLKLLEMCPPPPPPPTRFHTHFPGDG